MTRTRGRLRCAGLSALIALACTTLFSAEAEAHELRPAYLQLTERAEGEFAVMWKTPIRGDLRLSLWPVFSGRTEVLTEVAAVRTNDAAVQKWRFKAVDPLRGQTLRIDGLSGTMTDALVRVEFADGTTWVRRLTAMDPGAAVPMHQSVISVSGIYLRLGIEHILTGVDHLLFVLALLLITRGTRLLVKTVTAFTVAHSITLTGATLGWVNMPAAPVEAVIALSIVFVAAEIVQRRRGRLGMASRSPWIVAFTFGLLHGFGFAGALGEIGLPQRHIPLALLFFNVGVEVGQLLFIAAVLALVALVRRVKLPLPSWAELAPPYAIGSLAVFWVIQRVALF